MLFPKMLQKYNFKSSFKIYLKYSKMFLKEGMKRKLQIKTFNPILCFTWMKLLLVKKISFFFGVMKSAANLDVDSIDTVDRVNRLEKCSLWMSTIREVQFVEVNNWKITAIQHQQMSTIHVANCIFRKSHMSTLTFWNIVIWQTNFACVGCQEEKITRYPSPSTSGKVQSVDVDQ